MRALKLRDKELRCPRCYQRKEICICPILPTVKTRAQFLILRHINEAARPSNTGRLVALTLPNSRIVPCGGGERVGGCRVRQLADQLAEALRRRGTYLLWPDGTSAPHDGAELPPPEQVVVLDATWRQARKLYSRMPVLRSIPRLALPFPAPARERLRDPHREDGMSTLEAVAAAVRKLEGSRKAEPLERLYDEVVRRNHSLRWGGDR